MLLNKNENEWYYIMVLYVTKWNENNTQLKTLNFRHAETTSILLEEWIPQFSNIFAKFQ